jgi:diacylglycerol kinase family enzyme
MQLLQLPATRLHACSAKKQYERHVRGALDAAGLQHELHVTQRAGHATDLLAGLELQGVSAVVFMGGDGTVHEGLQVSTDADADGAQTCLLR